MQAYQNQLLPPSGVSHALSVRLTPAQDAPLRGQTIISHLVTAKTNQLQLWQVRERIVDGEVRSELSCSTTVSDKAGDSELTTVWTLHRPRLRCNISSPGASMER